MFFNCSVYAWKSLGKNGNHAKVKGKKQEFFTFVFFLF